MRIKSPARLKAHQIGGFNLDVGLSDRELHGLILADWTVEHHTLLDVGNDLVDEPVSIGDKRALRGAVRAVSFERSEWSINSQTYPPEIVGARPAGLATAIRLKQRAAQQGGDVSFVVVEKGTEMGSHILSGAVIDPIGLDRLVPERRQGADRPLKTEVMKDEFLFLTARRGLRTMSLPKLMDNHGNFVGPFGNVCRYLGRKAETLGGEIYPPRLPGGRSPNRRQGRGQSVPRLYFSGGCLVVDSAGFVNVLRIKGSHSAILSGILCAEHVFGDLKGGRARNQVSSYEKVWRSTEIGYDLYCATIKPLWSRYGTLLGVGLGGHNIWANALLDRPLFGTLKHGKPDHEALKPVDQVKPIIYSKADGVLTFDRLSSVFLSNTNHEEDQPSHLKVEDMLLQKRSEHDLYGGPSQRYCPAAVYEWVEDFFNPAPITSAMSRRATPSSPTAL
jgi:flavin-dependent dehydrogenase